MSSIANLNFLAILVCAISNMAIGMLWYGPLFAKQWMKLGGINEKDIEKNKDKMPLSYMGAFLGSIVMAFVLAHLVMYTHSVDLSGAIQLAFWVWLGFVATTHLPSILWEGKSKELFFLNTGYQLVVISVMSIILTYWV